MSNQPPNTGRRYNPTPDPDIHLSVHIPQSQANAIDSTRGNVTRSEWIRQAIRERLTLDKASK